jgi:tRNA A-37 threonylcarbamoyl transferase component Bud32/DNA-directed RNA polymerase specialized sigma24 family protein
MGSAERQAAWSSLILLEGIRRGNEPATTAVFLRYFARLRALARSGLSPPVTRRADPEDILMSAYRSFFIGARSGRFSLARRGDLWRLLSGILKHKLFRKIRHETRERRSIAREVPVDRIAEGRIREHKPLFAAEDATAWADELGWILSQLEPGSRQVLELRLEGRELNEIAHLTGRSERTVRRTLRDIRDLVEKRRIDPCAWLSHRDFLLQRMIGAGRMGKVYQAWQHSAGRRVAVKYLRRSLLHERELVERFIGESRIVAALRHSHIVGVHGLGRTPAGSYFIVMDFVDGPNLADVANRRKITISEAVRWTIETCMALEHSHSRGIIHCDLKPANLLIDESARIRVTDFGLARSLSGKAPGAAAIEGTGPFMAPEQVSRSWGQISTRTDVYGVGAVLFTLLTGRPPWPGPTLETILADVTSRAPVIAPSQIRPEVPRSVSEACCKCLSKSPADRYPRLQDVRSALAEVSGT